MEEWRDIIGYEGSYQISNLGHVKSLNRTDTTGRNIKEKILKGTPNKDGYLCVEFKKDGKRRTFAVHRLVAMMFIPNIENKQCVDHINTTRTDNRVENLRWVTHKENCNNELTRKHRSEAIKGKKNPFYGKKHTKETMQKIRKKVYCKELDKTYESIAEAEKQLGINHISCACNGLRKTAGKHKGQRLHWEFVQSKELDSSI